MNKTNGRKFPHVFLNVWALRLCRGLVFRGGLAFLWCLVNVTNSHFHVCLLYCPTGQNWCFTFIYHNLTEKLHLFILFRPLIWISYLKVKIFMLWYQFLASLIYLRFKVQYVLLLKGEETFRNHGGTSLCDWKTLIVILKLIYFKMLNDVASCTG